MAEDEELFENSNQGVEGSDELLKRAGFDVEIPENGEGVSATRKVELDIQKLPEELELPEEEPVEEPVGEVVEEETEEIEEETPEQSSSRIKLVVIGALTGLILILIIFAAVVFIGPDNADAPGPNVKFLSTTSMVNLRPFIVNFSQTDKDLVLKLELALIFFDKEAENVFFAQRTVVRDLIYRFLQGRTPRDLYNKELVDNIQKEITGLVNSALGRGMVEKTYFMDLLLF